MREIKFRAWDKKTDKIRSIDSIAFHNKNACFDFDPSNTPKIINVWGKDIIDDKYIILHRETKEVILMQYIGRKDKQGKEIYEGDIVKVHKFCQVLGENMGVIEGEEEFIAKIEFSMYGGIFLSNNKGNSGALWEYENGFHEESLEIIGNIYQNPELLKELEDVQDKN